MTQQQHTNETRIPKGVAFDRAIELISKLPVRREVIDFWDMPKTGLASDKGKWIGAADRLETLAQQVEPEFEFHFLNWASDAAVGAGLIERGLALLPRPDLGGKAALLASKSLDLKLTLGIPPNARDVTALFGPKVTAFGKANLDSIEAYIQVQLDARQEQASAIAINGWVDDAHLHPAGYSLFNGHPSYIVTKPPAGNHFSYSKRAESECLSLIRAAENTWREECDLPRVGEGWVSETKLYYELKAALSSFEVLQHHRPGWLGRQHLDVAIPALRVAVEFQGEQHDQPIAFFGGEEAFKRTLERDQRKLHKCRRHGWRLVYVRKGYCLESLLADLLQ